MGCGGLELGGCWAGQSVLPPEVATASHRASLSCSAIRLWASLMRTAESKGVVELPEAANDVTGAQGSGLPGPHGAVALEAERMRKPMTPQRL